MNLKEYLSTKPDAKEKVVRVPHLDLEFTIRRISVGERKRLQAAYKIGTADADMQGLNIELTALSLVPPMTTDEVEAMPAAISDIVMEHINEFNGWSKKGAAELADQFRPTA